jgi:hypothetical protein
MLIKRFNDGSFLEYAQGKFDAWCVYYTDSLGVRKPPLDSEYFEDLIKLSNKYGSPKVYSDFVTVYEFVRLKKVISDDGHLIINNLLEAYDLDDKVKVDVLLTILYSAMVAEEKKENTKLGAKIKRLGVHQILIDNPPLAVSIAANYSRGMGWREIENDCRIRGF